MSQSQFSLSWESYKSSICSGLCSLQQNGEFVDMTIAADGHFVKVHQVIVALSSPYIKELISSAPCQHPVVFLNNISYSTMCLILEYMYTGEVLVPSTNLPSFIEAAKALHINGLECVDTDSTNQKATLGFNDLNTESIKRKLNIQDEEPVSIENIELDDQIIYHNTDAINTVAPTVNLVYTSVVHTTDNNNGNNKNELIEISNADIPAIKIDSTGAIPQQYSISNRGSLQLILNRYIYYMHNQSQRGVKRRWRCIDYRLKQCPAYIDTIGDSISVRKNVHGHPFHDGKIIRKIKANQIYGSLSTAILQEKNLNDQSPKDF